jgi:hypothetical protein
VPSPSTTTTSPKPGPPTTTPAPPTTDGVQRGEADTSDGSSEVIGDPGDPARSTSATAPSAEREREAAIGPPVDGAAPDGDEALGQPAVVQRPSGDDDRGSPLGAIATVVVLVVVLAGVAVWRRTVRSTGGTRGP